MCVFQCLVTCASSRGSVAAPGPPGCCVRPAPRGRGGEQQHQASSPTVDVGHLPVRNVHFLVVALREGEGHHVPAGEHPLHVGLHRLGGPRS